jgi:hypothetical protein
VPTAAPAPRRCLAQSCAGHARPASVTVATYPPNGCGKGCGQAWRPQESALTSRLCGDPSERAGAVTGTRARRRLLLLGPSKSRACPHGISRALQRCRSGVAHSALGGHICVGKSGGVSHETQSGHEWKPACAPVRLPRDHALTPGVSQMSRGSPCCVACGTHGRVAPPACAQPSPAGALRRLTGAPTRDDW